MMLSSFLSYNNIFAILSILLWDCPVIICWHGEEIMKIPGGILMLVGALYWHVCLWMPAVFTAGLILFALGIERGINAQLDAVQEKLREQAVNEAIKKHKEENAKREPDATGDANKTNGE
jgi:hypothetical protein